MYGKLIRTACVAVLLALLPASSSFAEGIKLGFVDMQKALNDSETGQIAVENMKKLMDAKKAELQEMKLVIDGKKDELDKQGLLLNDDTRREREEEIRRLERDHTRTFNDVKEEIRLEEGKQTEKIRQELMVIVSEVSREQGYTLVLEKQFSAILYAPETIDMTAEIIKRYDEGKRK